MLLLVIFCEIYFLLPSQSELAESDEREERRDEHRGVEVRVVGEMERNEVEGEQTFDEEPRQVDSFDAEEATCQYDDSECYYH